jgi:hypothetical protein
MMFGKQGRGGKKMDEKMDDDLYPSEEDLEFVRKFDCSKDDVCVIIEFIEEHWWSAEWGFKLHTTPSVLQEFGFEDEEDVLLELHTGGWSGNEDIVRALKENEWFYTFYWDSSSVGGHEYFRFTKEKVKRLIDNKK